MNFLITLLQSLQNNFSYLNPPLNLKHWLYSYSSDFSLFIFTGLLKWKAPSLWPIFHKHLFRQIKSWLVICWEFQCKQMNVRKRKKKKKSWLWKLSILTMSDAFRTRLSLEESGGDEKSLSHFWVKVYEYHYANETAFLRECEKSFSHNMKATYLAYKVFLLVMSGEYSW